MRKQKLLYQASIKRDAPQLTVTKYRNYQNLLSKIKRTARKACYVSRCNELKRKQKNCGN